MYVLFLFCKYSNNVAYEKLETYGDAIKHPRILSRHVSTALLSHDLPERRVTVLTNCDHLPFF